MSVHAPSRREFGKTWHRLGPTLLVLVAIAAVGAVLCATSLYVGRHFERFLRLSSVPDGSEAVAATPMEYALTSTEYNDVIFVGDSAPLYAIDPKCFEELTRLKSYNLASFRPVSINGYLLIVQAYLSRHPAPRLIVLCVSPEVPGGADETREIAKRFVRCYGKQIADKSDAVNAIVQSIVDADGDQVLIKRGVSIIADQLAYSFQPWRRDVRDEILIGFDKETYHSFSKRLAENRGYAHPTELHGPPNRPANPGVRFSVQPGWDRAVRALISLTESAGVRLAIRLAPARIDAAAEHFDGVVTGMSRLQQEFPQISIDPTVRYYDPAVCYDLWHLNARGAKTYTKHLADDLLSLLGRRDSKPAKTPAAQLSP